VAKTRKKEQWGDESESFPKRDTHIIDLKDCERKIQKRREEVYMTCRKRGN